jgi:predicted dehydrogenase
MTRNNRRVFLEQSMLASASAWALAQGATTAVAKEAPKKVSPNERISVAVIGVNGRGGSHLSGFGENSSTEVTHICDADEAVGQRRCEEYASKHGGKRPVFVQDIRKLLEISEIDVVSIATPNHWHALAAIWGVQAGKHVYVEKPVSHNVSEGRRIVQAARKHNKIVQTGTQSRSADGMKEAIAFVHSGGIGKVQVARGLCYKRRPSIGPAGTYDPPKTVDYNLWLGPAPESKLTRPNFHYDWHWQYSYGNGDLGNQGIHQMDLCRWALGKNTLPTRTLSYGGRFGYTDAGETANTQVVVHDYGDQQCVFEVRGLPTPALKGASVGLIVEGSDGYVVMTSYSAGQAFDKSGKVIKEFKGGEESHYANFLTAVKSGNFKDLNADIEEGHLSSALCHLGNISLVLGDKVPAPALKDRLSQQWKADHIEETLSRVMEHLAENKIASDTLTIQLGKTLQIDPAKEVFVNNPEADRLLTREYRAPFVVPTEV